MNRFTRTDGTSPLIDVSEGTKPKVEETTFDINATKYGSALIGALIPVDVMETNPGETFDINYNLSLELVNPTVRKMMTGFKVYLHTYYNRWSDLWEGAKNFIDRGRSGKITGSIPSAVGSFEKTGSVYRTETTGGLYDYLGIPPTRFYNVDNTLSFAAQTEGTTGLITVNNPTDYINALYPMMYQRLWRDKYCPKNLLQNNKNVFPDNEDHFILPYSATGVAIVDYTDPLYGGTWNSTTNAVTGVTDVGTYRYNINTTTEKLWIDCLRFRQFNGDIFTTASPFPNMLRGDQPFSDTKLDIYSKDNSSTDIKMQYFAAGGYVNGSGTAVASDTHVGNLYAQSGTYTSASKYQLYTKLAIDFNLIRSLEAYTIFAERMGRTNGDYNSMIFAQFGYNPHNETREADYIGGMVIATGQNTITQTSESATTPLGTQAGQQLAAGGGTYKKFTAPDYGIIMTIMSIVPDTIYTQGIPKRMLTRNQSDIYFPIFNNLGPEPILNKELFVSGTKATDDDVFAYAERGYQYKSRQNEAHGMMRLDHTNASEYASRIMARRFSTTPQFTNRFTEMQPANIDWNVFSTSTDTPFIYSLQSNVFVRRPMPYITLPAGLSPAMA